MTATASRSFSIATPMQKLHFTEHPRYGSVYPIVTINDKESFQKLATSSTVCLSIFNTSLLYSTFVMPIYKAWFASIFANPIVLLPSMALNYILYHRNYVYFYGDRSQVVNMFLKPNGKQIIVESRDGESKVVNITDIYGAKAVNTRWE